MAGQGYRRFMGIMEHAANHGVPQILGNIVSAIAFFLGLSMLLNPRPYLITPSFDLMFHFATPAAWGAAYMVAATVVALTVNTVPRTAQLPVFMLSLLFAAQGLLSIPQAVGGGLPSAIFMYVGVSWICLATQLVCWVAKERSNEKAAIDHQP